MKKNDEITVECTDLSDKGFGIGHIDGMTIFVKDLLPEEKALCKVIKVTKTFAIARVIKRENDAPERVRPFCPKAGICGGCTLQNMAYDRQLELKEKQLKDLFGRVTQAEIYPVLGMKNPRNYRNKAQFPVGVKKEQIQMGFYRPHTNDIVDMEECSIQSEEINKIFQWLRRHLSVETAKNLRHLFIRTSRNTGEAQVVFIGRKEDGLQRVADLLHEQFPQITSIVFNRNEREDNVILGEEETVLYGGDSILEDCLGLKIRLHFKSFFQVNPQMMEVLYQKALEFADLKPEDEVIELYSGTGTIGMLAVEKAGHVTGVEIVQEAVENARENAQMNHIDNIDFVCEDASVFAARNRKKADVVMVDPPRKGMSMQGIKDVVRLDPRRIVYISCNPRTLARDIEIFEKNGYLARKIQPVDMFGWTSGVENVCLLTKEESLQDGQKSSLVRTGNAGRADQAGR